MNQVVHIFRKDVRRQWREIIVSLVVVAAYAWREAARLRLRNAGAGLSVFPFGLLATLVVVTWAFLILRAVHGESLVGNRQFWVTRPYEWRKLLVAKLIFIAIFVNAPLLVLQAFLLGWAGFSPFSHLEGLLSMQIAWILFVFLPGGTLATVTSSIGQFVLAVIGLLVYLMVLGWVIFDLVSNSQVTASSLPYTLALTIALAVAVVVVGWQYSRRKTTRSRLLLFGLAIAVPITLVAMPYRTFIRRGYPEGTQLPAKIAFDPAPLKSHQGGFPSHKEVVIRIPLLVSGLAEGSVVSVPGLRVSIQGPNGQRWNSGWRCCGRMILPGHVHSEWDLSIDRAFFERVKSTPVDLRVQFALDLSRARKTMRVVARPNQFTVPGEGRCNFTSTSVGGIACLFPFATPYLLWSAASNEVTCAAAPNENALPTSAIGYGWTHIPNPIAVDPVKIVDIGLMNWGPQSVPRTQAKICPGTPLTFRVLQRALRTSGKLEIPRIRLGDYELTGFGGFGSFGMTLP